MVLWMFTPMFPQYLELNGRHWYWYHLWHPVDHLNVSWSAAAAAAVCMYIGMRRDRGG